MRVKELPHAPGISSIDLACTLLQLALHDLNTQVSLPCICRTVAGAAGVMNWASGLKPRRLSSSSPEVSALVKEPSYCHIELMIPERTQERLNVVSVFYPSWIIDLPLLKEILRQKFAQSRDWTKLSWCLMQRPSFQSKFQLRRSIFAGILPKTADLSI